MGRGEVVSCSSSPENWPSLWWIGYPDRLSREMLAQECVLEKTEGSCLGTPAVSLLEIVYTSIGQDQGLPGKGRYLNSRPALVSFLSGPKESARV